MSDCNFYIYIYGKRAVGNIDNSQIDLDMWELTCFNFLCVCMIGIVSSWSYLDSAVTIIHMQLPVLERLIVAISKAFIFVIFLPIMNNTVLWS